MIFKRICRYFGYTTVWIAVAVFAVLLVIYILIINSGFITKVVLPVASIISGEEIVAEKFEISPFRSKVYVRNFRLGKVENPRVTIGTVETGYGLWRTIGGTPRLYDTLADRVNVYITLDSKSTPGDDLPGKLAEQISRKLNVDLQDIAIRNSNIYLKNAKSTLTFSNLNLSLDRLQNSRNGTLKINSKTSFKAGDNILVDSERLKITSVFRFSKSSVPELLKINISVDDISGRINDLPVKPQSLSLAVDGVTSETNQLLIRNLTFQQLIDGQVKSDISLQGRYRPTDKTAMARVKVNPLSPELIRLASVYLADIDPGRAELFYDGRLEWSNTGTASSRGSLKLTREGIVTILGTKLELPEWSYTHTHDLTHNYLRHETQLRAFSFACVEQGRDVISLTLGKKPLQIRFDAPPGRKLAGNAPDWKFKIDHLNLSVFNPLLLTWEIFFGDNSIANAEIDGVLSRYRPGFDIKAKVDASQYFMRIDDVDLEFVPIDATVTVDGNIDPFSRMFIIDKAIADESTAKGPVGHAEITGAWDLNTFVLTTHTEVSGVNNMDVSQQPMIPDFVRDIIDDVMCKFSPAEFRFSADSVLDLWNGFLRVPKSRLRMLQPNREQIVDIADYYINWDADDVVMGPCTATVNFKDFDIAQVNGWLPEQALLRGEGTASGRVFYKMDGLATFMEAEVDLLTENLSLKIKDQLFKGIHFAPRFKISLTDYDRVKLDHMRLYLRQGEKTELDFRLAPTSGSISIEAQNPLLQAELAIAAFNLPDLNILGLNWRFNEGLLDATLKGTFRKFSREMQLQGDVRADRLSMARPEIYRKNLTLHNRFKLDIDEFRQFNLSQFDLDMKSGGDAAVVALQGNFTPEGGSAKIDCTIFNRDFLPVFYPHSTLEGIMKGKLELKIEDSWQKTHFAGKIDLDQLKTPKMNDAVSGHADIKYLDDHGKITSTGNTLHLENLADITWERHDTHVKIESTKIDLLQLQKLFLKPGRKEEKPDAPPVEPSFDFKPFTADIDLKGITYSDENKLALTAKVSGNGPQLNLNPVTLTVNDTPVELKCEARSEAAGILYALDCNTAKLDIGPVTTPMFEGSMKDLAGIAENVELHLTGRGLRQPALWDNMNGQLTSSFSDISIPDQLQSTIPGRIFFLPFRAVNEIRNQLGGVRNKRLGNAFSRIVSSSKDMRFNEGTVNVTIRDGRLYLDNVDFSGDFIKQLKFAGALGFGTDSSMLVDSTINVEEVILPITMRGTAYNPEPDYAAAIVKFAAINTTSLVKNILGIFSSGNLQDLIEGVSEALSP